ncbi:MAG: ABC transporter ATP-binding protein [Planctomycetes bacterium RBG_16_64_10]|nr:MAG: ABC transporter ATP-binding protein [Planctomycetes bacterium RBG_16_64_10]
MNERVIEIHGVTRRFGHQLALKDIHLDVPRGSVFGLVGENGAGKTTLIKHVLGLLKAQTGTVRVFAADPVGDPVAVLGRIGYLSEDRDLPDWMRVDELMSYSEAFYPRWDRGFAAELRRMFQLDGRQRIRALSRGQRARAGLLVALAHRPDLLLLDEPSSGLDPVVRRDILAAIVRTVAEEGRTVVFSSHLLDEVERVADRVALIHAGEVLLCSTLEEIIAAHRLITLHFAEPLAERPTSLPGAVHWAGSGHEWICLCNGQMETMRKAAATAGAEVVDERPASLEEIYLGRVAA